MGMATGNVTLPVLFAHYNYRPVVCPIITRRREWVLLLCTQIKSCNTCLANAQIANEVPHFSKNRIESSVGLIEGLMIDRLTHPTASVVRQGALIAVMGLGQ